MTVRALALVGLIAIGFGLGSYYTTRNLGAFTAVNMAAGALALLLTAGWALMRGVRGAGGAHAGRRLLRPALLVIASLVAAFALERVAHRSRLQWDWTAERRYELAAATRDALASLPGETAATLYFEDFDPRVRRTRLLLRTLAESGPLRVRERRLAESANEADRYGVTRSNSVVLELDGRFETVDNPTEGSLYEALRLLARQEERTLYLARGEGEGDPSRSDESGYSGLGAALHAEGYRLREFVLAALDEVPSDASAVLVIGPRRPIRPRALDALDRYLERGGSLVALLDPGSETGLEALLVSWGFALPDVVVVDPASGSVEGDPPGVNPILFNYAKHPVVQGLDSRKMLFLLRARPVFPARKPTPEDELKAVAFTSQRAWLSSDVGAVEKGLAPERPPDTPGEYLPVVSIGRYPREGGEARIVALGDSDFASNRYLRALYNLDLILNAVHWATEREASITLRPKALTPFQFPLTPQDSLRMFYGVGLVIPELCLMAAAVIWLRRRSA